ncbi:DEAD/DEAH box helicase [Enhygromyxa salina]|uniref:DEAD/DEAH box helicase n=1 Tax=Enhygromyxa salina TaxID=215803 RepID=UPI0015E7CC52|nr:DEAD/DEAH box helicase [Enhygromyxa salina]
MAEAGSWPSAAAPEVEPEPAPSTWEELELPARLQSAVETLGWTAPTPVQGRTFATMVAGTDVLVQSQTGSGKTGAFCLPWLASRFEFGPAKQTGVQLIVLLPTRELAKQVCDELVRLAVDSPVDVLPVYGGTAMAPQLDALAAGVHAVVGTPGRILDHIRRRSLDLSRVRTVVLDECDEMLSMGFLEDIRAILSACPQDRQTCLFSATVPRDIERIARRNMRTPVRIELSGDEIAAAEIDHAYYPTSGTIKTRDLLDIIILEDPTVAIVFCNTREETRLVANVLQKNGYSAHALSSDLTQAAREQVMGKFRDRKLRFLVATDVAARGIDVSHVSHVINYSFPENAEVYVHRTGRTGRAGRAGQALSIVSPLEFGSFYTLTKSYKSIQFTERKLPPADDLAATRTEVKLDRISHDYSQPVSPEWLLLARRLVEDPRGERVVAYLLHEAIESNRVRTREQVDLDDAADSQSTDSRQDHGGDRDDRRSDRGRDRYRSDDSGPRGRSSGRGDDRGGRGGRGERSRDRDRDRDRGRHRSGDRDRVGGPGERERPSARDEGGHSASVDLAAEPVERRDSSSEDEPRRRRRRRSREDEVQVETPSAEQPPAAKAEAPEAPSGAAASDSGAEPPGELPKPVPSQESADADAPASESERTSESEGEAAAPASEDASEASEDDDGKPKKRRRRRRRRSQSGEDGAEDSSGEATRVAAEDRSGDGGDGVDGDDDEQGQADEQDDVTADGSPRRKRRRRRRRRGGKSDGEQAPASTQAPSEAFSARARASDGAARGEGGSRRRRRRHRGDDAPRDEVAPEPPRVSQDEIVIDIDIDELSAVRTEFGEIDELDELTLKGRRRAVLDDLTDEVEVEDLTERDAEDDGDTEQDGDDELETGDHEPSGEQPLAADPGVASSPADADALSVAAAPTSDGPVAEAQPAAAAGSEASEDAEDAEDAEGDKKKRRRRRRRKKAAVVTPELTCPPHKDFWELWAGKFTAADFVREEDSKDAETEADAEDEDEVEVARPAAPFAAPEAEDSLVPLIPVIQDAPVDDSLVRVGLNIGRRHGHKAAHVRALLRRLTGLHGKAVKDLTVRDDNSLFRMDVRHFETVVARLDGSVVDSIELTLVQISDLDADAAPLRLPDDQAATIVAANALADVLDPSDKPSDSPGDDKPSDGASESELAAAAQQAKPEPEPEPSADEKPSEVDEPQPEASPALVTHEGEAIEPIAAGPEEG